MDQLAWSMIQHAKSSSPPNPSKKKHLHISSLYQFSVLNDNVNGDKNIGL